MTTFVVQTSQNLQPNYSQITASLLMELVAIQRAQWNGSSVNSVPTSQVTATSPFTPSVLDSWINGLWFTSLILSLSTALMAGLAKQWLHQYMSSASGTPRDRSRLRHFRFNGLETWHVAPIIELLPVIMHTSLALFLTGGVLFLLPLKMEIALTAGIITSISYTWYLVSNVLPIFYPECPYKTPLTSYMYYSWNILGYFSVWSMKKLWSFTRQDTRSRLWIKPLTLAHAVAGVPKKVYLGLGRVRMISLKGWILSASSTIRKAAGRWSNFVRTSNVLSDRPSPKILPNVERQLVDSTGSQLDAEAISWLHSMSSNPTVRSLALNSICGLPYGCHESLTTLGYEIESGYYKLRRSVKSCKLSTSEEKMLERLLRGRLHWGPEGVFFRPVSDVAEFVPLRFFGVSSSHVDYARTVTECLMGGQREVVLLPIVWTAMFENWRELLVAASLAGHLGETLREYGGFEELAFELILELEPARLSPARQSDGYLPLSLTKALEEDVHLQHSLIGILACIFKAGPPSVSNIDASPQTHDTNLSSYVPIFAHIIHGLTGRIAADTGSYYFPEHPGQARTVLNQILVLHLTQLSQALDDYSDTLFSICERVVSMESFLDDNWLTWEARMSVLSFISLQLHLHEGHPSGRPQGSNHHHPTPTFTRESVQNLLALITRINTTSIKTHTVLFDGETALVARTWEILLESSNSSVFQTLLKEHVREKGISVVFDIFPPQKLSNCASDVRAGQKALRNAGNIIDNVISDILAEGQSPEVYEALYQPTILRGICAWSILGDKALVKQLVSLRPDDPRWIGCFKSLTNIFDPNPYLDDYLLGRWRRLLRSREVPSTLLHLKSALRVDLSEFDVSSMFPGWEIGLVKCILDGPHQVNEFSFSV